MLLRICFAFVALSLFAQEGSPPPTKTVEQQLAEAKAENAKLSKLLNAWALKAQACDIALTNAQAIGFPEKTDQKR